MINDSKYINSSGNTTTTLISHWTYGISGNITVVHNKKLQLDAVPTIRHCNGPSQQQFTVTSPLLSVV